MKQTILILIAAMITGYVIGCSISEKVSLGKDSLPIKKYLAKSTSSNPNVKVQTKAIEVKTINHRGDKQIQPIVQQFFAGPEEAEVVTEVPETIKAELSKVKAVGFGLLRDYKVTTYGGLAYEFINFGDFSGNLGMGGSGPFIVAGYAIRPSMEVVLGVTSDIFRDSQTVLVFGASIRI